MTDLALYVPTGAFAAVRNPFGKDTANLGLYRALARHGGFGEICILSHGAADPAATEAALFEGRPYATRLWTESVLRTSAAARAGAVLRGLPDLASLAWQRQAVRDRSHSLIGLVHTLAPPAVREQIAGTVTAPLQPWDALVCTSPSVVDATRAMLENTADYLASRFGGTARPMPHLPLIPLGVDVESLAAQADRPEARARARAELGVPEGGVLVLWLGRLSPEEKAFPQPMFRAVQEARALADAPLHFAMAGWFPDAAGPQLYAEAARAYAPDVPLHVADGNDRARVADLWAAADVFLSLVDNIQETFGLTPIEAMAAGLPVVASDWDGYRYTVRDGVEGFLAPTLIGPPGAGRLMIERQTLGFDAYQAYVGTVASYTAVDVGATAAAIARLARDPDLRRRMGAAGRARVRSTFAWPVVARQYRALVDELAALRAASPRFGSGWPAANPVRGEPFADFAGFATAVLTPGTRLSLNGDAAAARAGLARAGAVGLDRQGAMWRADPGECAALLDRLGDGDPQRLDALLAASPAGRREALALALAWMCKLGILRWDAEAPPPADRDPFPGGWAAHRDAHCIWIVSPEGYGHTRAFDEIATALSEAFVELGGSAPVVRSSRDWGGRAPIVLGAHLLGAGSRLPPGTILYNFEQVDSGSTWLGPDYLDLLRRHPVLDYSRANVAALRGLGIIHARHLALGYADGLTRIAAAPERDIDVLFYGSVNPRRAAVLAQLRARGLAVTHLFDVFGAERDAAVARARVVLNLHFYEAAVFESARVVHLLANRACVVTEGRGEDPDLAPFRDGLAICPYDGLVERCAALVRDDAARKAQAARGAEAVRRFRQADLLRDCIETFPT